MSEVDEKGKIYFFYKNRCGFFAFEGEIFIVQNFAFDIGFFNWLWDLTFKIHALFLVL